MTRLPEEDEAGRGADSLNLQGDSDTQVHESHGSPKLRLSEISSEHTVMTLPKTKNSRKKKRQCSKLHKRKVLRAGSPLRAIAELFVAETLQARRQWAGTRQAPEENGQPTGLTAAGLRRG